MYRRGKGIKQDDAEALQWMRKAANQDDADGLNNMGVMYEFGYGVKKDLVQAQFWYEKTVLRGNKNAVKKLQRLDSLDK